MVNFPASLDDNTALYIAVNNLRTSLTSGIDASVTTIPVVTTSGFPSTGFITILTGSDITQAEAISYTNTTSTTFTGATRGADGTTAREHEVGDNVDLTIVAAHHNELKDAIINLEHFVGISGSEVFLPRDGSQDFTGNNLNINNDANSDAALQIEPGNGAATRNASIVFASHGEGNQWSIRKSTANNLEMRDIQNNIIPVTIRKGAKANVIFAHENGNLGIGTNSPTEALHVVGSGIVTGDLDVQGELTAPTGTFSTSLTISGVPVATGTGSGGGTSTLQEAYDAGDGSITTDTDKPVDIIGQLDVSNTICLDGYMEVGNRITVGRTCAESVEFSYVYAEQDTEQLVNGTSYVDANCETAALTADHDYLVIYCSSVGGGTSSTQSWMKLLHGASTVGETLAYNPNVGTTVSGHAAGTQCNGFTTITGTGSDTLKFQFRSGGSSTATLAGGMAILGIDVSNLTVNSDYYTDYRNDSTTILQNATTVSWTSVLYSTFNVDEDGDYIYLGSVEGAPGVSIAFRGAQVRFLLDGSDPLSEEYVIESRYAGSETNQDWHSFQTIRVITLTAGNHTFDVQGKSRTTASSDYRRPRHVLIKASVFDQVVSTEATTGFTTTSPTYVTATGVEASYLPRRKEPLVVLANAIVGTDTNNGQAINKLKKEQGVSTSYYRLDHGQDERRGTFTSNRDQLPVFMMHTDPDEDQESTWTWLTSNADGATATVAVGRNKDNTGDKQSDVIIFGLSYPDDAVDITASGITANTVAADYSLTVSGLPVNTEGISDPLTLDGIHANTSMTVSGTPVSTAGAFNLTVRETDSSPLVTNVHTIVVTTGTLTDNGSGQVTILTGGGGGAGGTTAEDQIALISQVFGV